MQRQDSIQKLYMGNNFYLSLHPEFKKLFKKLSTSNSTSRVTSDCGYFCNNTVLPVTGLTLQGKRINNLFINLDWETLAEINSKYFSIERSVSPAGPFDSIYVLAASGTTYGKTKYKKTDANSYMDISYYRIKETDIDGRFVYSNTIAVQGYNSPAELKILSNPGTNAAVGFALTGLQKDNKGNITIVDATGRRIYGKENTELQNRTYRLNEFVHVTPGFYTIVFNNSLVSLKASFVVTD